MTTHEASAQLKMFIRDRPGDWAVLVNYLEAERVDTWKVLAKLDSTEEQTQQARGRAAFIEKLLNFTKMPASSDGPLL